ncbi:MAG: anaerobic ribonucleoside-triphosphate reductase [Candidatus Falkowbacteria bacterium]
MLAVAVMTPIQKPRQKCEIYSRVVGYLSPVNRWNEGKRSEFGDRRTYDQVMHKSDALLQ